MSEAISIATGENDHVLVSPAGNVTSLPGELATFGESRGREKRRSLARSAPRTAATRSHVQSPAGRRAGSRTEAFGASMRAVERLAVSLVAQFDPLLADELLDDWEQLYDLPDECLNAPVGGTAASARQHAPAHAWWLEPGVLPADGHWPRLSRRTDRRVPPVSGHEQVHCCDQPGRLAFRLAGERRGFGQCCSGYREQQMHGTAAGLG